MSTPEIKNLKKTAKRILKKDFKSNQKPGNHYFIRRR
jgi:hypothetical protein